MLIGFLLSTLGYPIVATITALWVSRHCLQRGLSAPGYFLAGGITVVAVPTLFILGLSLVSTTSYQGRCGGWMDSPPTPCSLWDFYREQALWTVMLAMMPALAGAGITVAVFLWMWFTRKKPDTPDQR